MFCGTSHAPTSSCTSPVIAPTAPADTAAGTAATGNSNFLNTANSVTINGNVTTLRVTSFGLIYVQDGKTVINGTVSNASSYPNSGATIEVYGGELVVNGNASPIEC